MKSNDNNNNLFWFDPDRFVIRLSWNVFVSIIGLFCKKKYTTFFCKIKTSSFLYKKKVGKVHFFTPFLKMKNERRIIVELSFKRGFYLCHQKKKICYLNLETFEQVRVALWKTFLFISANLDLQKIFRNLIMSCFTLRDLRSIKLDKNLMQN